MPEAAMTTSYRSGLVGFALSLGGLIAGTCHLFNLDSPRDIIPLSQYARFSAPLHMVLFLGGLLVLLGWIGQSALLHPSSGILGNVSFVCLFLGIICGDLLHCILEFSIFPVLDATAPYALPGLADATYRSAMLAPLLSAGRYLLLAGMMTTALSAYRGSMGPRWSAAPFAIAAGLQVFESLPITAHPLEGPSFVALYLSLAILGLAILLFGRRLRGNAPRSASGIPSTYEDSPPVVQ
jgi:hypothetical protein